MAINATDWAVTVSTMSILLVPGNKRRRFLFIQNRGVNNVFIQFAANLNNPPTFPSAKLIPPNGFINFDINVPFNDIYAIASAGSNLVSISQGLTENE